MISQEFSLFTIDSLLLLCIYLSVNIMNDFKSDDKRYAIYLSLGQQRAGFKVKAGAYTVFSLTF